MVIKGLFLRDEISVTDDPLIPRFRLYATENNNYVILYIVVHFTFRTHRIEHSESTHISSVQLLDMNVCM